MSAPSCEEPGCITCGDQGIPMRVLEPRGATALCEDERHERHEVAIELIGPVAPGARVLVHAGVAIGAL
jgi:hydrogenase maturation factor